MTAVTLQATGAPPFTVDAEQIARSRLHMPGDKRGFLCTIYRTSGAELGFAQAEFGFVGECMYLSSWPTEFDKTWIFKSKSLQDLADQMADHASDPGFLPKGFGYPATPAYLGRQLKLEGNVEEFALKCITDSLAQAVNG